MSLSGSRNVYLFDGLTRDHISDDLQNGSITNIMSFNILADILLIVGPSITIKLRATGRALLLNAEPLNAGDYDTF